MLSSPRSSRTATGGTQTAGMSPAASSRARFRASRASVFTRASAISFTSSGCATVTLATSGRNSSCHCQASVVASSTTASVGARCAAAHVANFARGIRRGGRSTRWVASRAATTTDSLWTSSATNREIASGGEFIASS